VIRITFASIAWLLPAALLAAGCSESVSPRTSPLDAATAATGVRITGLGKIMTTDGVAISFDFDIQDDLTGRLKAADSSDTRGDGTVGTIWIDSNHPGTSFTAFRSSSSLCSDPSKGAEIDGTGQEDTGGFVSITMAVCDNGPSGSGDLFRFIIPVEGYDRQGPVTSGDIVKSTTSSSGGTLTVSANTSGSGLDPDGYTVTLDGTSSQTVATNGSVTFGNVSQGDHTVALAGVASNCTVTSANPQTVTMPSGGTASAAFSVSCTSQTQTGDLVVTTNTSGSDRPSGYTITVDGTLSQFVSANGSVTFSGLAAGGHSVEISGDAPNCTLDSPNPQTASVPAGGTATVTFSAHCASENQPPVVNAGPDETALTGLLYSFSWSFSDADHNGPWSYTVNWGDGSQSTGTVSSEGTVSSGHTYVTILPRSFTIAVTVRDASGASGSDSKVVSVLLL
jgi:hypothetical protein